MYYLGVFLIGAYQDIMGDLHNLFGRVNEVHVFLDHDEESGWYIEEVIEGSTIGQVLALTQWDKIELMRLVKLQVDAAIKSDRLKPNDAMKLLADYERGLQEYTYLSLGEMNGPSQSSNGQERPLCATAQEILEGVLASPASARRCCRWSPRDWFAFIASGVKRSDRFGSFRKSISTSPSGAGNFRRRGARSQTLLSWTPCMPFRQKHSVRFLVTLAFCARRKSGAGCAKTKPAGTSVFRIPSEWRASPVGRKSLSRATTH